MDNSLESTRKRREIFWDHLNILYKARTVTEKVEEKAPPTYRTVFFVAKIHYAYVTKKAY